MTDGHATSLKSYRDLIVWSKAVDLAALCYEATVEFPRGEVYGMTAQIRRASTSIPANIAEGYGRDGAGQFVQFLKIAQGSLKELETHLIVSERVGLLSSDKMHVLLEQCDEIGRMLGALLRSVQRRQRPTS